MLSAFRLAGYRAVIGGVCAASAGTCFVLAVLHTTVANVVFTMASAPLIAAAGAWLLLRERIERRTLGAMVAAVIGIGVMMSEGLASGNVTGTVLALVTTVGFAGIAVVARWGGGLNMLPAVCFGAAFTMVAGWTMAGADVAVTVPDLLFALASGGLLTAAGATLFLYGAKFVPAGVLVFLTLTEVVLAPIWMWAVFDEVPSAYTLAGGAIVLSAIFIEAVLRLCAVSTAPDSRIPSMKSRSLITNAALADRPDLDEGASVGLALAHDSAARHVRGTAAYIDDLPEPAGTVHVAPGSAGAARGAIRTIDLAAVRAFPGVLAVLTAADIPGANDCSPAFGDDPILAAGEILFHGQVVFAVVAESRGAARRAARSARIEVDSVAPRVSVDDGLADGAEVLAPLRVPARGAGARDCRRLAPARRPGEDRWPGALLPRRAGGARDSRRGRRDAGPVLDPAPVRGPEPSSRTCSECPARRWCASAGGWAVPSAARSHRRRSGRASPRSPRT